MSRAHRFPLGHIAFAAALAVGLAAAAPAQISIVNMIPNARSGETSQDSEPNLAVNPANPLQIAGSAFTPNPIGGAQPAPIYVSVDGGATWTLNAIVPSGNGNTGDITLRFGGISNVLYAGILRGGDSLHLQTLRTLDFTQPNPMTILVDRTNVDQPYVQATTTLGGPGMGLDRVYIGLNDLAVTNGRTATLDRSLDGVAATPPPPSNFGTLRLETRVTPSQDQPPVRPAIHPDGTIYGVFYGRRSVSGQIRICDLTVVRDDAWASGATPFTALVDPGDGLAGMRARTNVNLPFINAPTLGQERLGSSLSIAVDPRDSSRVYVAYAEYPGGSPPHTLHLIRSNDRGQTWSADLMTVTSAINPALAVNIHGKVGFLYQQVTGSGASQRWETHLRRSTDLGGTWDDMTLARPPSTTPAVAFLPYIGDYVHLMAVGKDFYGVFSANNRPDLANFPQGVTYQRNANFTTQQLFATNGTTPVNISIDPFFFHLVEVPPANDFYVRDWTDSPTSGDTGLEPSTHPIFYSTSDVWNRRSNQPGPFPNDQPQNENAGNGPGAIGDNWAFARIRRNAPAASGAQTVTAHFLVSKFGTGSNYVDSSSMDPDVLLPPADPTVTFAANEVGPKFTPALPWHLNAIQSSHLCLGVEISTPSDPYVAPSLLGNTPGWFTGTDLRFLLDNNKAQRNMGLSTTPASGSSGGGIVLHGVVHNAATFKRPMTLYYEVEREAWERVRGGEIELIGKGSVALEPAGVLTLDGVAPGENRFVGVRLPAPSGDAGEVLAVHFREVFADQPLDGFAIGVRLDKLDATLVEAVERHRSVFLRLYEGFGLAGAKEEVAAAEALLANRTVENENALEEEKYLEFLAKRLPALKRIVPTLGAPDPFSSDQELERIAAALSEKSTAPAAVGHTAYLNRLDSLVTSLQLEGGDVADILQTMRLQKDLFARVRDLATLSAAAEITNASREFIKGYQARKLGNRQYSEYLAKLLERYASVADALKERSPQLQDQVAAIRESLGQGPAAQQKAHRAFLLSLHDLEQEGISPAAVSR